MRVKVNTVIVDDKPMYAENINDTLIAKNSESEFVRYIPNVFSSRTHYKDAEEYIRKCLNNKTAIDLFFCDYHLDGGGNGLDLFDLFKDGIFRPYKILHSNTTKRFTEHSEEFLSGRFDQFSSSKTEEMISQCLNEFEEYILKVKIYGNPNYRPAYYANHPLTERKINRKFGNFNLADVLYVNTADDMHTIVYRHFDEESNSWILKKNEPTGPTYRIGNFLDEADGLNYIRINQSLLINLLWVSKVDVLSNKVHFITPNSLKLTVDFKNISLRMVPENFNISSISNSLHRYFL